MPTNTISESGGGAETMKLLVEAKIKAALQKPKPEVATAAGKWNLWVYGVHLLPAPNAPPQPQKMVEVGSTFYIPTVVWFNPAGGVNSPAHEITNLGQGVEIRYHTAKLDKWELGPNAMNVVHNIPFVSDQSWYIDVLELTAESGWEGCYEMNICALVKGCNKDAKPPLAGFATAILDIDPDVFYPPWGPPGVGVRWEYDIPLRFMIFP